MSESSETEARTSSVSSRRILKCTRSTAGSDLSKSRQAPLPGVGLAGDEKDAQAVAESVDLQAEAVVDRRHLAGEDGSLYLNKIAPPARQIERERERLAGHGLMPPRLAAVDLEHKRHGAATLGHGPKQHLGRDRPPEKPEARGLEQFEAAVGLFAAPGLQEMHRRAPIGGLVHIVHLAVADKKDRPEAPPLPAATPRGRRPP